MTKVLQRVPGQCPPEVKSAHGVWLEDTDGNVYLDAVSGGAAVSAIGHGDSRVNDAIAAQLDQVAYAHNSFFTNRPAEELAELLLSEAPEGLSQVLYCSGGSEAIESALKLARQYWVEKGRPQKSRIISRRQSYHGATLGTLSVGGNMPRRDYYAPMLFDAQLIEPCYAYRLAHPDESEEAYGKRAAQHLEAAILEAGAENVAAFVAEPVVGATLGCAPAVKGYFKEIRAICDRHDVLLILDEVMCGTGRTGYMYACLEDEVTPDLLAVAKGMGGGFVPIGAVLVHERLAEAIRSGSGALRHGFTYMAHPLSCAAALAVQKVIKDDGLVKAAQQKGELLRQVLDERFGQHPNVGDIRGRGLFLGLELVRERNSKQPFDPSFAFHSRVKAAALEAGLMIYPSGGTIDGKQGDHILLAPAYVVSETEIEEIAERLSQALDATLVEAQAYGAI
ncbi:aspartate aminotransferase family protein [Fodinicurvata halophila]|uniref:Aspartate aminotransferase family protein n=1 Tax=Fodinicurvata halophila TaxID=1419723 RepID=A0ABV8UIJ6_9PROT